MKYKLIFSIGIRLPDNSRLQFNRQKIHELLIDKKDVSALEYQYKIFEQMGHYLTKFIDLEIQEILLLIFESANKWEESQSTTLPQFATALPQERLKMAEQFKNTAADVFTRFLFSIEDKLKLAQIIEQALVYYLKEFAAR
ncbi:MAG: hypothetical protein ACW99A_05465 [Candidatus Kariarchaeaceae archaeon]|jgi:hypothetical protein